ncbi:ParB N-terminal domain-containing protein [Streptomyces sedi]|uniref:Transcriptional regulator n=1 Tax=Streptomyces sedi TaxID=555059 RepID=A0A5C4V8N0_9ACTN|nr:ParB N-terminal domain-containing protein [Streptomyces sedi]TNM32243.1 transcriptional regulator [Streptomyces sedi]
MFHEVQQPRPVHYVPVDELLPADSPRLGGLDEDHARGLAESGRVFEPILVHREPRRVVDGMHRLRATILRGERRIAVRYVDGAPEEMFIRSVQSNVNHGLPLSRSDRRAAVARILATHAHWSDRAIATVTGVSPKTVGAARGRLATEESPHSNPPPTRVGRDGRLRPVDTGERRERALALLAQRPGATLREVAAGAGVSISTAHRLRQRLRAGEIAPERAADGGAPLPPPGSGPAARPERAPEPGSEPERAPEPGAAEARGDASPLAALVSEAARRGLTSLPAGRRPGGGDEEDIAQMRIRALEILSNDPSLRFTDSGRALLRWLNGQAQVLAAGEQLLAAVPPHCAQALAEVASHYARAWERFAVEMLEREHSRDDLGVAR